MSTNNKLPMICDTCQRALDVVINDDGAHYSHAFTDPDDHRPVPVAPPADWRGVCDFCAATAPTHVLPARAFPMPGLPDHMTAGTWAACEPCAALLRDERWEWLTARAIARFHAVYGYPMPASGQHHLARLHQALSLAVTGALRPITDPPPTDPPANASGAPGGDHA